VAVGRNELLHDARKSTIEENANGALRVRYAGDGYEFVAVTALRREQDDAAGTELDLAGLSYFDEQDTQILSTQNLAAGQLALNRASQQRRDGRDIAVFGQAILPDLAGGRV